MPARVHSSLSYAPVSWKRCAKCFSVLAFYISEVTWFFTTMENTSYRLCSHKHTDQQLSFPLLSLFILELLSDPRCSSAKVSREHRQRETGTKIFDFWLDLKASIVLDWLREWLRLWWLKTFYHMSSGVLMYQDWRLNWDRNFHPLTALFKSSRQSMKIPDAKILTKRKKGISRISASAF